MASPAMKMSLFLLLTLSVSLHTHARDSQFFNKIPSSTTNNNQEVIPTNEEEPKFLPQNENSYGLYGHESGQNPPSTETTQFKQPLNKYLPKNYNPVAYVTQPEDFSEATTASAFPEETTYTSNNNDNRNNYYYNNNNQQEEESEFRRYPTAARDNAAGNFYYNGGSSFNSQPQGGQTRGGSFQPQGMSDTRYMENGKYFYDINSEKFSTNHPYETLRGARPQKQFTNTNSYEFNADNSIGGYQREDFQDEDNNMP